MMILNNNILNDGGIYKKNKVLFSVSILLTTFVTSNCYAFNAYSVGSKYAEGVQHAGDDFTINVTNAATAYKQLTDCNSYKSVISSYDYMKGSRLGSSQIYFINGHANDRLIQTAGYDKDNYRTGISIYDDGYVSYDNTGDKWIYAGLNGRNMNGTRLITFAGCLTAAGSNNLTKKAVAEGAATAVGFSNTIVSRVGDGPNWLRKYNTYLSTYYTVGVSIDQANIYYPNTKLARNVSIEGSKDTMLGKYSSSSSLDLLNVAPNNAKSFQSVLSNERKYSDEIKSTYKILNLKSKIEIDMTKEDNIDYSNDSIVEIVNLIKKEDSDFNTDDYKIFRNVINEESGYGHIFFTYYINGNIETNKVYLVIVDNNVVEDIILAGVNQSNINKIKSIENNSLNNKIEDFEKNKKRDSIYKESSMMYGSKYQFSSKDIMTNTNEISISEINPDIKDYEEKYFYDYNTNELSYELIMNVEKGNTTYDGEMIRIVIE